MEDSIPHNKPSLGPEEQQAALSVLRSGWVAAGKEVRAFEEEFSAFLAVADLQAVAVTNGTAALYLALMALQAKGKKIAFPAYTCTSLRHAVKMTQGVEQLIDSRQDHPNMNFNEDLVHKADLVIAPHMYGAPQAIPTALKDTTIEDTCQALGAKVNGEFVGTQTKVGIFSFYASKLMTSGGQGGMLVSRDPQIIDFARDFIYFDCKVDNKIRFNFQMTDLQAAIGRIQLKKLPAFLRKRREILAVYESEGLPLVSSNTDNIEPVAFRAVIKTNRQHETLNKLRQQGILAINPLEPSELLGDPRNFPNAANWTNCLVSLPIFPDLPLERAADIARFLKANLIGGTSE